MVLLAVLTEADVSCHFAHDTASHYGIYHFNSGVRQPLLQWPCYGKLYSTPKPIAPSSQLYEAWRVESVVRDVGNLGAGIHNRKCRRRKGDLLWLSGLENRNINKSKQSYK